MTYEEGRIHDTVRACDLFFRRDPILVNQINDLKIFANTAACFATEAAVATHIDRLKSQVIMPYVNRQVGACSIAEVPAPAA